MYRVQNEPATRRETARPGLAQPLPDSGNQAAPIVRRELRAHTPHSACYREKSPCHTMQALPQLCTVKVPKTFEKAEADDVADKKILRYALVAGLDQTPIARSGWLLCAGITITSGVFDLGSTLDFYRVVRNGISFCASRSESF